MIQNLPSFQNQKIRHKEVDDKLYFSVVDIVAVLTENDYQTARKYWNKLAERLKKEGAGQLVTNCHQLKLMSVDGKFYKTDCADVKTCFRIIQSIPSKKAEPFKQWLASVGQERLEELENPEIAQARMMEIYKQQGYSADWIKQRVQTISTRKNLTNEWDVRGATEKDYAIFTAIMSQETFGLKPVEHKKVKGLKRENLRDHMSDIELALTNLGEATAKEIHKQNDTFGTNNLKKDVTKAGKIAGNAKKQIEQETGRAVVSPDNYLQHKKINQK
jgi:hypothetical protein